jgi:arylsulfatase A-like enzyme
MQLTPSFDLHGKLTIVILLLAALFFSWFSDVKKIVTEWAGTREESQASHSPNVLMIVVDDLGYDDTSAINRGGLTTPSIAQLASTGVTFRRHYADSTCTPSRVAMLTGRYPERSGFRPVGVEIPAEFSTLAQQFQLAGYTTYLTGKWHAGEETEQAKPENKGFDSWFGFLSQFELSGEVNSLSGGPSKKPRYNDPMLRTNGGDLEPHKGHLTDILTDHSIEKIQQLQTGKTPWFLYHAFLAPHAPIQPATRYAENFPDTPEGKYSALITQLDDAIGRILDVIDRDNTLVVFVSDNGGTNLQRNNNFPFHGKKSQLLEGAFRTPLIFSFPSVLPTGKFIDNIVMNVDIYPTLLSVARHPPPDGVDGQNLWNLMLHDRPLEPRIRSWEGYHPNTNTLSYSLLSSSGDWRLTSRFGTEPLLFNLSKSPEGAISVADSNELVVTTLTSEFWQDHWAKVRVPAIGRAGSTSDQTLYSGFDALRTPNRFGFAIGLEIGPLPINELKPTGSPYHILAGQKGSWELRYRPEHGLEWILDGEVLEDAYFDPARCNAIVLTGYLQPRAHLTQKAPPVSPLKMYSSGYLRDSVYDLGFNEVNFKPLESPTFVNFQGKAIFASTILSAFSDSYSPRDDTILREVLIRRHKEEKLSISNVDLMNAQLCKEQQ